ncbi:MAG: hypothetical protein HYT20_03400 [Candidatus Nealsonbacteria bacterium]|nr:hypothetical protein [Candidatus Nealsonbacteria bacterium]
MKSALIILLVLSFMGIAVFGAFGMNHGNGHGSGCIGAIANGRECAGENNSLQSINFHLKTFKSFSTAIFLLIASLTLAANLRVIADIQEVAQNKQFVVIEQRFSLRQQKFTHWLAIHENSPAIL